jgi:hypothetical protein
MVTTSMGVVARRMLFHAAGIASAIWDENGQEFG